jgi:hypothetical protein
MGRLTKRDVTEILELLEGELDSVPRLEKVEKMKWRSRIRQQENWLTAIDELKPDKILVKLKGRLPEVFRLYPASFSEKVVELLKKKALQLERKSADENSAP